MIVRLLYGLIAALIGSLIVALLVFGEGPRASLPWAVVLSVGLAWFGAALLAFTVQQGLHVAYVRDDCANDLQAWVAMSPARREQWQRRDEHARRVVGWTFTGLVVGLTCLLDLRFSKALWHAGIGSPAPWVLLMANVAAASWAWLSRRPPKQAGEWRRVAPGHWSVRVEAEPAARQQAHAWLAAGVLLLALAGTKAVTWVDPADAVLPGVLVLLGAAITLSALWSVYRLQGRCVEHIHVDLVRTRTDADVIDGQALLPMPTGRRFATKDWQVRLLARQMGRRHDTTWLDMTVPAHVPAGTSLLDFQLRVELPPEVPEGPSVWMLQLERRRSREVKHVIAVPQDVLFQAEGVRHDPDPMCDRVAPILAASPATHE